MRGAILLRLHVSLMVYREEKQRIDEGRLESTIIFICFRESRIIRIYYYSNLKTSVWYSYYLFTPT